MRAWQAIALLILAAISFRVGVQAQQEPTFDGLMAIAKMAGACGILDSQVTFQKTTQMQGGDAFVVRYWAVEATRLGMTMQQYSDQCNKAIAGYGRLVGTKPPAR